MNTFRPRDLPQAIIVRALEGDAAAWRQLYDHYYLIVRWAVGRRVYRWPELVSKLDDIVQEVWLELSRRENKRLRYHDFARGVPFWRFLSVITARRGWQLAKRILNRPKEVDADVAAEGGDAGAFASRLMHADFLDRFITLAKKRLDERDFSLFYEHYVLGDTLKDVGARLGMKDNATYQRNNRLEAKLRGLAVELLGQRSLKGSPELMATILTMLVAWAQGGISGSPGAGRWRSAQEERLADGAS